MRADRLLSILLLLQVHRRITARDLATRLEVSERTILRDMEALSSSGVPVIAERGSRGGWGLLQEYQTKLTGLTAQEIRALFLAGPPRLMADLGLKQPAEAAFIKLQASLPSGARQQADFVRRRVLIDSSEWRDSGESAICLPVLLDALWRECRVRFYYARVSCEPTERTVDPLGLVAKGSIWYLIALAEGQPRTYRVSRISEPVVLPDRAVRPVGFDLATYWDRAAVEFRDKLPRYYATFVAQTEVMRWVRYRGWRLEEETPQSDGIRVRLRFDAEEDAVKFALSYGGDIRVVEPEALRARIIDRARALLTAYGY